MSPEKPFITLEICQNGQRLKEVSFLQESLLLGKAPSNDLCLTDPAISRQNSRLGLHCDGILVEDLQSTNGTYFNQQRQTQFILTYPSESFTVGDFTLRVTACSGMLHPFKDDRGLQLLFKLHQSFIDVSGTEDLTQVERTQEAIDTFVQRLDSTLPLWCSRKSLVNRLMHEIAGFGPIDRFVHDSAVSEIMVNGAETIFVERLGRIERVEERFLNDQSLLHCIQKMIAPLGRILDESHPMVDARIPGKARINAIVPPLCLQGCALTIRKHPMQQLTLDALVDNQTLSEKAADFLRLAVSHRKSIIVAGATDSGKTTLLKALAHLIDEKERLITIEDTAELMLEKPHLISLEARPANIELQGAVSIRDLVKNSLRMRPDRIIIGECRGGEALDMLQAMNTGHEGSLSTLHASSPRDVLSRLETMVLLAGMDLPLNAIRQQVCSAIDLIVFLQRSRRGQRQITAITEVGHIEGEVITTQDLFERHANDSLKPTGIVPRFLLGDEQGAGCFRMD